MVLKLPAVFGMGWRNVSEIEAWKLSMKLKKEFDAILDIPPACHDFKFCQDARDAVGSPARNIAEGFGRFGDREFARFLDIALGSHLETQTNLQIAKDRGFVSDEQFSELWKLSEEAKATTLGLLNTIKRRIAARRRRRT